MSPEKRTQTLNPRLCRSSRQRPVPSHVWGAIKDSECGASRWDLLQWGGAGVLSHTVLSGFCSQLLLWGWFFCMGLQFSEEKPKEEFPLTLSELSLRGKSSPYNTMASWPQFLEKAERQLLLKSEVFSYVNWGKGTDQREAALWALASLLGTGFWPFCKWPQRLGYSSAELE